MNTNTLTAVAAALGAARARDEALATLRLWTRRRATRGRLADLPPHLLKDIGVTPDEAAREAAKPFWRD